MARQVSAPTAAAPWLATWTTASSDITIDTADVAPVLFPEHFVDADFIVIAPGMETEAPQAVWQLIITDGSVTPAGQTDAGVVVAVLEAENVVPAVTRQHEVDNGTAATQDIFLHLPITFDIRGMRPRNGKMYLCCVSIDSDQAFLMHWWAYKKKTS